MEDYNVPGVSIALARHGKIEWVRAYGIANEENGQKVDVNTLFQAGSISKPIAALAALQLFEKGLVRLDEDVNNYLQGWKIENNDLTKDEKVTLERILTHTAGLTVHGFPGYRQYEELPEIEEVLNGEGNTSKVKVNRIPGSNWKYSGGGYSIMEKVIEDVSGLPLEEYMNENVLGPLSMNNSTFKQPLSEIRHSSASAAHNSRGKVVSGLWHNYPEQAAAGLWTTPNDLAKYCIEIHEILTGRKEGILKKETIELMLTKHERQWGLGPRLDKEGDSLLFGHGGNNKGFANNYTSFAYLGNSLIIMTNGDNGGDLIDEIQKSIFTAYQW
ncbi:class A beta-lactamase-related serine hydrolase [Ulvibacterium marinum]|uniref:Class A beta-lactamase-related serine hydrolase n=2 Tax=Ulvibacterium marinum TaxID=2419782 RepID=A0A3B0C2M9_9FLAO|nr:class A beta-lactamase-related serine hydrolase [Ulvibacterium marinum]